MNELLLPAGLLDHLSERGCLLSQDLLDASLDGSTAQNLVDLDRLGLGCADAVQTVDSLLVQSRHKELVEEYGVPCGGHIQPHARHLQHAHDDGRPFYAPPR